MREGCRRELGELRNTCEVMGSIPHLGEQRHQQPSVNCSSKKRTDVTKIVPGSVADHKPKQKSLNVLGWDGKGSHNWVQSGRNYSYTQFINLWASNSRGNVDLIKQSHNDSECREASSQVCKPASSA